jgi:hypothetical protein
MRVVSADAKTDKLLSKNNWLAHVWSRDGKLIYGVRYGNRHYSLVVLDTGTNSERELFALGTSSEPVSLWYDHWRGTTPQIRLYPQWS